ncbi:hypothetical protein RPAAT24_1027 [Rickettsia parkeri str. AT|nr:hypothetical protein RPAAT24_1027 [Rickettsia parkeri str. AT\
MLHGSVSSLLQAAVGYIAISPNILRLLRQLLRNFPRNDDLISVQQGQCLVG